MKAVKLLSSDYSDFSNKINNKDYYLIDKDCMIDNELAIKFLFDFGPIYNIY